MTRSMSREEIRSLQLQIRDARSISEVLRLARTRRIERIPGGYRLTPRVYHADTCEADTCDGACCACEYTAEDRAWFRAPIGGGL